MGFISQMTKASAKFSGPRGEDLWREIFGNKEKPARPIHTNTNSYARTASESSAVMRLLEAMRSRAPGGWTDDRYEESKHMVGIQYCAIHRIGEQMMQSEFQVFRKDPNHPDGKSPVKRGEPGYGLVELLERPNNEDSWGDWMYSNNQQLGLTGTALTWTVPNAYDRHSPKGQSIAEMYVIPTATAIPQPVINPEYPHGYYRIQPLYPYGPFSSYPTPSTSVGAPIPAQWMMRVKYQHPLLRYDGYSPLTALRLQIDELEGIERSRWYKMMRTLNPEAVLQFDEMEGAQPLDESAINRIRTDFENNQQGPQNSGRLFVSTPGAKLEPWGTSPKDMDYPNAWEQLTSFILGGGFGITKPAAGMTEDSSYATLFATLKQLHLLTLKPICDRIAARLTRFVAPFFGDDLIVEIRCPRIDDHEVMDKKLSMLIQGKAIKKNELRKQLEFPVTKEEWGDEFAGEGQEEQQGMPGMPGMGGAPAGGPPEAAQEEGPGMAAPQEQDQDLDEDEANKERPSTHTLGEGALGPRKSIKRTILYKDLKSKGKSLNLYQKIRKVCMNGHATK